MPEASGPVGSNAVASAAAWFEGAFLGTLATTVAVIAIAVTGLLMLSGRVDLRRAAHFIFGCFIIFGATTIASGIFNAVSGPREDAESAAALPMPLEPRIPRATYPPASSTGFDPYAGAVVSPR